MAHASSCTVSSAPAVGINPSLQISPNLEALLQHDDLTRRSTSSSSTVRYFSSSHSPDVAVSLPPPPRHALQAKKPTPVKQGQRKRSVTYSESWPDELLVFLSDRPLEHAGAANATAIPNPYINPAPVVLADDARKPGDHSMSVVVAGAISDDRPSLARRPSPVLSKTIKQDKSPLLTGTPEPASSASEHRQVVSEESRDRRERLESNRISGPVNGTRDSAVSLAHQSTTLGEEVPLSGPPRLSNLSAPYGNDDVNATQKSACRTAAPTPRKKPASRNPSLAQPAHITPPETTSTHSLSTSPRSLPPSAFPSTTECLANLADTCSTSPPAMPSTDPPQLHHITRIMDDDRHSFMDLFSSEADDVIAYDEQAALDGHSRPLTQQLSRLTIPSSKLYDNASNNVSSGTLATMVFAPPSPEPRLAPRSRSSSRSSSITVSTMVFSPPSPGPELPSAVGPAPASPTSTISLTPIEFAPPPSPIPIPRPTTKLDHAVGVRRRHGDKRSHSLSPQPPSTLLPSTTNLLGRDARADLIRRNRKLTQVFGQMPTADLDPLDLQEPKRVRKLPPAALVSLLGKQRHHRHAVSTSCAAKSPGTATGPSSPWQIVELPSVGRRHSISLTPSSRSFDIHADTPSSTSASDHRGKHSLSPAHSLDSGRSFIDLSDEGESGDDSSTINHGYGRAGLRAVHQFSSTPSLVESVDRQERVARRRKRDQLSKLHRFLGSHVPAGLVQSARDGIYSAPLSTSPPMDGLRESWRLNRKSGASTVPANFDRGKEELDHKEKALNVRRAQKMEKMFGTPPPPQKLFHTRHGPSTLARSHPSSPVASSYLPSVLPPDGPGQICNLNRSAYRGKTYPRPATTESRRHLLLPKTASSSFVSECDSVYLNYQNSINSLVDIIDRDDRHSLIELHRFLNREPSDSSLNAQETLDSTSIRSDRRYSLPTNASVTSLASQSTVTTPREMSMFEVRRRRAAKLTHFFGVHYRELIRDVLDSIEKGVVDESRQGNLQPEEAEVLLRRVQSLKSVQNRYH